MCYPTQVETEKIVLLHAVPQPINLGFCWRNFLPKRSYCHPPLNLKVTFLYKLKWTTMVKNYCVRQGERKREKFLKVIICLTAWNTSIRFLLYCPSYTISAVIFHSAV